MGRPKGSKNKVKASPSPSTTTSMPKAKQKKSGEAPSLKTGEEKTLVQGEDTPTLIEGNVKIQDGASTNEADETVIIVPSATSQVDLLQEQINELQKQLIATVKTSSNEEPYDNTKVGVTTSGIRNVVKSGKVTQVCGRCRKEVPSFISSAAGQNVCEECYNNYMAEGGGHVFK